MKKILYIADVFPYPTISGGKIRTYNLLKIVSQNNKVDFLCLNDEKVADKDLQHIKNMCNSVNIFYLENVSKIKRLINFITLNSDKLFLNYKKELDDKIGIMLEENDYDVIFVDSLFLYRYIKNKNIKRGKCKIILDIHNVENEILFRTMKETKNPIVKIYSLIEHFNIKKIERYSIEDSDISIVVSKRDRDKYLNEISVDDSKVCVVENGFDSNVTKSEVKSDDSENYLLFVGSLWYRPNYDGLYWFIDNVWDDILIKYPNLKLKVIGKYRNEDKKIDKKNVEYLGFVDDLSIYYNNAICSIVPLFIGSGTRLKILEAFSYKCPVISTDVGCEGLDVTDGENIIISNDKDSFIEAIEVLINKENKERIINNAYSLIKKKYDWNVIKEKVEKILTDC